MAATSIPTDPGGGSGGGVGSGGTGFSTVSTHAATTGAGPLKPAAPAAPPSAADLATKILIAKIANLDPQSLLNSANDQASQYVKQNLSLLGPQTAQGYNTITQFNKGAQVALAGQQTQLGGYYDNAIGLQNQLSNSIGASLQAQSPSTQDASELRGIGAPPAQSALVKSGAQAGFGLGGSVLSGLGNLDASSLAAQKAGALGYGATLPGLMNIQSSQALANFGSGQAAAAAKIIATQPGLAEKLFSGLLSGNNDSVKALQALVTNLGTQAYHTGVLGNQAAATTERANANIRTTNASITDAGIHAAASIANNLRTVAASNYGHDVTLKVALAHAQATNLGANGLVLSPDGKSIRVKPGFAPNPLATPTNHLPYTIKLGAPPSAGNISGVLKSVTALVAKNGTAPKVSGHWNAGVYTPTPGTFSAIVDSNGVPRPPGTTTLQPGDKAIPLPAVPYASTLQQVINQAPASVTDPVKWATKIVRSDQAYSTPGKNGVPYNASQYRVVVKAFLQNGFTPDQIRQTGLFPDDRMLSRWLLTWSDVHAPGVLPQSTQG